MRSSARSAQLALSVVGALIAPERRAVASAVSALAVLLPTPAEVVTATVPLDDVSDERRAALQVAH